MSTYITFHTISRPSMLCNNMSVSCQLRRSIQTHCISKVKLFSFSELMLTWLWLHHLFHCKTSQD